MTASPEVSIPPAGRRRVVVRVRLPAMGLRPLVVSAAVAAIALCGVIGTGYRYVPLSSLEPVSTQSSGETASRREVARLAAELRRLAPKGPYIVIERNENRLQVRTADRVLRTMRCSAGSGRELQEEGGQGRRWVFDTPTGRFQVIGKITDPVWRKPDWAFVEEGEPIPDDPGDRFEYNALGEYGLDFGDGYLIHGTLYERLLGRAATHGCVRLGREDLRYVYRTLPVGTTIFIH